MKRLLPFLLLLISLGLVSCLDKLPIAGSGNFCPNNRKADGTCPGSKDSAKTSTWNFSNSSNYSFDSNFVEISSGRAALKEIDTNFSGSDFSSGSHAGTTVSDSKLLPVSPNSLELNSSNTDKYNNIIAYWKFNETSWDGTTGEVVDSSPNSNNGTAVNNAQTFSGGINRLGCFDRTNLEYVQIPNSPSLQDFQETQYSISLWLQVNSIPPNGVEHYVLGKNGNHTGIRLAGESGGARIGLVIFFENSTRLTVNSSDYIEIGKKYHIVSTVSFSQRKAKLYIDGALVSSADIPTGRSSYEYNSAGIGIGALNGGAIPIAGCIDEVAIWNDAITAADITSLYNLQSKASTQDTELSSDWTPHWDDIIGYWKMDGNWQDSSGNDLDITLDESPSFSTDSKVGNKAGYFNNAIAYVPVAGNELETYHQNSHSIMAWIKPFGTEGFAVSKYGFHTGLSYGYSNNTGNGSDSKRFIFNLWDNTNSAIGPVTSPSFKQNQWYHVVGVVNREDGKSQIYVNGELEGTFNFTPGQTLKGYGSHIALAFGGTFLNSTTKGRRLDSNLDEVSIWSTNLSATDIKLIYNRQKQKYAASYRSPVIDLASSQNINQTSKTTELPFMKELTTTNESSSEYTSLSGDLSHGLVGYWNFNEAALDTVGGDDFQDLSTNSNNANENGGVTISSDAILSKSILFDGVDDFIQSAATNTILPGNGEFTLSSWYKANQTSSSTNNDIGGRILTLFRDSGTSSKVAIGFYGDNTSTIMAYIITGYTNIRHTSPKYTDGNWHHIAASLNLSTNKFTLYADGVAVANANISSVSLSGTGPIKIGVYKENTGDSGFFKGSIDEVGIWNRALTDSEIQQLYRRGANRIKYQVRSCSDSTCSSEPEWKGPGGDGTTYFSELYNRSSSDITSMFSSCGSSDDNLCSAGEFSFSGSTQTSPFQFNFVDGLINNYSALNTRYFQYRVLMEAEENTSCDGEACLPRLTALSFETANDYYDISPSITSTTPVTISGEISKVEESVTGGCSVKYQFSKDGTNFSYYNSGSWVSATDSAKKANSISQISAKLKDFISSGNLYLRAYLISDGSKACDLNSFTITQ